MADKTQVEVQLIKNELTVPPPDNLIAGDKGAVYIDLIKISTQAEFKRGTLLMSGTDGYVASTQAGLATASGICILCDDITIGENEFAEVPAYFEGDFNDAKVIFPFETESDDHDAIVEAVREPLRKSKIFLRHMHE
ncbi:MAG: hypothetical protein IJP96_13315 [Synergistaceae bacterium]|nr:hypothetical protein [Synergistaceae bacterium]MBR0315481.1 hypothetical protein [Synergistaceae bacterium]